VRCHLSSPWLAAFATTYEDTGFGKQRSVVNDQAASVRSLYDHLSVPVTEDPWPDPRPEPRPRPPGTVETATIETIDNDRTSARLGGLAPLVRASTGETASSCSSARSRER
jgi:hypothetical protein